VGSYADGTALPTSDLDQFLALRGPLREFRRALDGLPTVSTWTILGILWEAHHTWQERRTWCHTGVVRRRRRDGTVVTLTDPDDAPEKR
jgi:hypothetical protein